MTIGERIATRRKELGLTQLELARKLGYKSKSTINKIELGINDVSQRNILSLSEALETTPTYLLGLDGHNHSTPPISPEKKKLLEVIDSMSNEELVRLLKIIEAIKTE